LIESFGGMDSKVTRLLITFCATLVITVLASISLFNKVSPTATMRGAHQPVRVFHPDRLTEALPTTHQEPTSPTVLPAHMNIKKNCGPLGEAMQQHMDDMRSEKLGQQMVVWRCLGGCGGLGDRLRGMYGTYLLALLLNRKFFFLHPVNAHFGEFLNSPDYPALDWVYPPSRDFSHATLSSIDQLSHEWAGTNLDATTKDVQRLFVHLNQDPLDHLARNPHFKDRLARMIGSLTPEHVRGCVLNWLAFPTPKLQQTLDVYMPRLRCEGCVFLAIHIRVGIGITWSDPERVPPQRTGDFYTCAEIIEKAVLAKRSAGTKVRWFVTSDSEVALRQGRERGGERVVETEGDLVHIDRSAHVTISGVARTYAEHILLSKADVLIGSRSGFSELAAERAFHPMLVWPTFAANDYAQCRTAL
jgi:hypothetical protein